MLAAKLVALAGALGVEVKDVYAQDTDTDTSAMISPRLEGNKIGTHGMRPELTAPCTIGFIFCRRIWRRSVANTGLPPS